MIVDLEIKAESANVRPAYDRCTILASVTCDLAEVLAQVDLSDVLKCLDQDEILELIGRDRARIYFDLVDAE
jgi:hypothetical protein